MDINNLITKMTLKEKLFQMFILGFSGEEVNNNNINIQKALQSSLGGIIFFSENISERVQFTNLIKNLQKLASIPIFTSIDQEGGRVERTNRLKDRKEYLSPSFLVEKNDIELIKKQTEIMSNELKSFGINMNFAPVLDVNTNPKNPIIGVRAYGNNVKDVIYYSEPVYKILNENNIIAVGKHFPGHGEAIVDSHIELPQINLKMDELENIHIAPFKYAINNGLDAIMIAHVNYKASNFDNKPSSLSKEVITEYLQEKLNFKGLIISDDMIMGGVANHYSSLEACIKGIEAGIDLFIFRNSNDETINLISELEKAVLNKKITEERIDSSVIKILFYKQKYNIL